MIGLLQSSESDLNRQIEAVIRRMPEQYAWSYNRYKTPAGQVFRALIMKFLLESFPLYIPLVVCGGIF